MRGLSCIWSTERTMNKCGTPRRRGQVAPRGDGKWLVRLYLGRTPKGKRMYRSAVVRGTIHQAQQTLTRMQRDVDTSYLRPTSAQTLTTYLDQWLRTKARVSQRTLDSYRLVAKLYLLPELGQAKLSHLSPLDIQDTINTLRGRDLAPRTIRYAYAVLCQALGKAVKLGLIGRNPASDVELPSKQMRPFTILSPE